MPWNRSKTAPAVAALVILTGCLISLLAFCSSRTEKEPPPAEAAEPVQETPMIEYRGRMLPILEDVPANEYAVEAFSADENGFLHYADAPLGVDVSSHQGEIDWEQAAGAGIDFAMVRAGRRGYTEGGLYEDERFAENIRGALAAGLDVGTYFFSQAITAAEAEEEAAYVLELIDGCDLTYPVVFDWEPIPEDEARTDGLGADEVTECALAFCRVIAEAGYTPSIYFNVGQGYLSYRLDRLTEYPFWLAEYHESPGFYYHFDLWQFTHEGRVPGIDGYVDLDLDLRGAGNGASARPKPA